jgi:hypothetical protein
VAIAPLADFNVLLRKRDHLNRVSIMRIETMHFKASHVTGCATGSSVMGSSGAQVINWLGLIAAFTVFSSCARHGGD